MIQVAVAIVLFALLLVPAMIFCIGCVMGGVMYHLSRQTVIQYQPMRKAVDQSKEKNQALALAAKLAQETVDIQKSYIGGIKLTRDQYVAAEGGK